MSTTAGCNHGFPVPSVSAEKKKNTLKNKNIQTEKNEETMPETTKFFCLVFLSKCKREKKNVIKDER